MLGARSSAAAQPSSPTCTYLAGTPLKGKAEENSVTQNNPPDQGGADTGTFPYPSYPALPPPQQGPHVVYGKVFRVPAGQNIRFPISIQVPTDLPLNEYQEGTLTAGPEGQYYTQFGGRVVRQWRPAQPGQREVFGMFRIDTLFTIYGRRENNLSLDVPLGAIQP